MRRAPGRVEAGSGVCGVLEHLAAEDEQDDVWLDGLGVAADDLHGAAHFVVVLDCRTVDQSGCHYGSAAGRVVEVGFGVIERPVVVVGCKRLVHEELAPELVGQSFAHGCPRPLGLLAALADGP